MDPRDAADALWDAADDAGTVIRVGLPKAILDAMQAVVDEALWQCPHVESASDLPPGLMPKLCVAGGRAIACLQPACVADMHDLSYRTQNRSCIMCAGRPVTYRPVFTDEACALSMVAWVCYPCAAPGGPLAQWCGVPDA